MSRAVDNEKRRDPLVFETLAVRNEGAVLFVEINALPNNLFGHDLIGDLVSLVQQAEADEAVRVIVFKSADPDYFISHVDVTRIKENREAAAKLDGDASIGLMIRATGKPDAIVVAARGEVVALDRNQPVYGVRTLSRAVSQSLAAPRCRTFLLALFSGVALMLAVVGIYGVMSYAVAQRTREIGIRLALGAQPSDVVRMVAVQGITLAVAGIAIGLAASFALTRVMATLLFEVGATDLMTFTAVPAALAGVALAACFVPARRATKVDPMVALRCE